MRETGPSAPRHESRFPTTRWSMVVSAGRDDTESKAALVELCEAYWYPVYAYARRRGADPETARDRTQGFFTALIERHDSWRPEAARGRFWSFLLASFDHYVSNDLRRERAAKRGGDGVPMSLDLARAEGRYDAEPGHDETPEKLYERRWSLTLLGRALGRLADTMKDAGKEERFHGLQPFLTDHRGEAYRLVGERLGMSEAAVKVAVLRLRRSFGEILRDEVAQTVHDSHRVDDELRHLLSVLSDG